MVVQIIYAPLEILLEITWTGIIISIIFPDFKSTIDLDLLARDLYFKSQLHKEVSILVEHPCSIISLAEAIPYHLRNELQAKRK